MTRHKKPGPPPMPASKKTRRVSISIDPELYAAAKASGNISKFIRSLYKRRRAA